MSLATPESVQSYRQRYTQSEESTDFRFYALYDKVYRKDVLIFATPAASQRWSSGVDDQTFETSKLRNRAMVGRTDARAEKPNLSTTPVRRVYIRSPGATAPVRSTRYS